LDFVMTRIAPTGSFAFSSLLGLVLLGLTNCAQGGSQVHMIDANADRSAIGAGLDLRDFTAAASSAVQSMLASPALVKPTGGRYVLAISNVTNETMQRIDTDLLIKQIRVDLLNSGRVVVTTAVGLDGPEDPMAMKARQLRESKEFNQRTVAKQGQMAAPDLSLTGKIIQLNTRLGDGTQRIDYAFQLSLTDINQGLAIWEGQSPISKLAGNQSVAW
jgi:uncharacterized protein (TIGR02722 family)